MKLALIMFTGPLTMSNEWLYCLQEGLVVTHYETWILEKQAVKNAGKGEWLGIVYNYELRH
jgi:hypothetical protein